MSAYTELPESVLDEISDALEVACILAGLPPEAADALSDTLAAMVDEVTS